jgi:hypothetical protein
MIGATVCCPPRRIETGFYGGVTWLGRGQAVSGIVPATMTRSSQPGGSPWDRAPGNCEVERTRARGRQLPVPE